ncbi:MAG: hypothetical protein JRH11_23815, partial [Deltaproteobacteria bacterium]|nr:hypothetical protein [Deltaproteobacteria bacterium]
GTITTRDGCRDLSRDPENCGTAGTRCANAEYCIGGVCVCRPGLTLEGTQCVDLNTDPSHCGAVGTACSPCSGGACVSTCPGDTRDCRGACVDDQSDPLNCGGCGDICRTDEVCVEGECDSFTPQGLCTMCPCPLDCSSHEQCCAYPGAPTDAICVHDHGGACP